MLTRLSAWRCRDGRRGLSLHWRVGLLLAGLCSVLGIALAAAWQHGTRHSISEEVEAATRVAAQWLLVMRDEWVTLSPDAREVRVLTAARQIGRIRANALEIHRGDTRLYVSPPSSYKQGRQAPAWFSALLTPPLSPRSMVVGDLELRLLPDASRAVLDAWDDLVLVAGWGGMLLLALLFALRWALMRALQPLAAVGQGLEAMGNGRFDTRLPAFAPPELARLSRAFNGMADRLTQAVNDNVRLETERELAQCLQQRLSAERKEIAQELHDELAQGITGVRALAGAIVQRCATAPALRVPAEAIIASTGDMQDGVRRILHRLHTPDAWLGAPQALLQPFCQTWSERHPEIALHTQFAGDLPAVGEDLAACLLRVVQEGLTNVLRHSWASEVVISLDVQAAHLMLSMTDNGTGRAPSAVGFPGSGLGLAGMRERVCRWGGTLETVSRPAGGFSIQAVFPIFAKETV